MNKKIYIGRVHFRPIESNVEFPKGNSGAFCNVIALAATHSEYKKIVSSDLEADGYIILSIVDVELLNDASDRPGFSKDLIEKSNNLTELNNVVYGDAFTYSDK